MNINFNNVKETVDFQLLAEGEYKLKCISSELKTSRTNKPMLVLSFSVLDDPTNTPNRRIDYYFTLDNDVSLSILKKLLNIIGYNTNQEINVVSLVNNGAFLSKDIRCSVSVREYQNQNGETKKTNTITKFIEMVLPF